MPFQLSEYAWPLDDRLREVNCVHAFAVPEAGRSAFVIRRLVTELCRFLHGDPLQDESPAAPTKVFISHTKLDLGQEPKVVEALQEYLKQDQPIKVWYDSGDIPGGSRFAQEIANGIEDSSLLCVRTDHYASREWCRKEIQLAKEKSRPIVVINALTHNEIRSFPYLGNVPELRWQGDPAAALDLLLKETLQHLHSGFALAEWQRPDDRVFLYPPEHLTMVDLKPGTTVLYPDPPTRQGGDRYARQARHRADDTAGASDERASPYGGSHRAVTVREHRHPTSRPRLHALRRCGPRAVSLPAPEGRYPGLRRTPGHGRIYECAARVALRYPRSSPKSWSSRGSPIWHETCFSLR